MGLAPQTESAQSQGAFDLPDTAYSAGHRGIDLPGRVGEPGGPWHRDGSVRRVGGGVGVVTVDDGTERTYRPVDPGVERGDAVCEESANRATGSSRQWARTAPLRCLHLGPDPRTGSRPGTYLDPLDRLGSVSHVRARRPGRAGSDPTRRCVRERERCASRSAGRSRRHSGCGSIRSLAPARSRTGNIGVRVGAPLRQVARAVDGPRIRQRGYGNRVIVPVHGDQSYNHLSKHRWWSDSG